MHFMSKAFLGSVSAVALFGLVACGSDPATPGGGTGGSSGTGGSGSGGSGSGGSASGGSPGTGGSASGGATGSGGSSTGGSGGSDSDGGTETGTETGAETGAETGGDAGGSNVSFFITSRMGDGNLGGLAGADKICQDLAEAAGFGGKTWKAYLSSDTPKVDAKTRIGNGPWYNVKGVKIADDLAGLHTAGAGGATPGNKIDGTTGLTEKGAMVAQSQHDVLTGSNVDGTLATGKTCMDWTGMGIAQIGHHNRTGGSAQSGMSWNSAHENAGCTAALIPMRGGGGRFYCFAVTP